MELQQQKEVSEQSKSRFKAMLMNAHSRGDGQIMHTDEDGERHVIANPNLGEGYNVDDEVRGETSIASAPLTGTASAPPQKAEAAAGKGESSALSAEDAKENEPETVEGHFEKLAGTGRSLGASGTASGRTSGSSATTAAAEGGSNGMRDVLARAAAARMARLKRFEGGATSGGGGVGDRLGGGGKSAGGSVGASGSVSGGGGGGGDGGDSSSSSSSSSTGATLAEATPLGDRNTAAPSKTATRFARRKVTANFRGSGRALAN